jgi:eukaryotic-like serine/threonine-protein kinase
MDAPVTEGEILAGKYRVERVLGIGGMGVVVAAHHIQLDKRVALKFLLPEATTNAEVVARFAREARAAVKIESEHVARVIDVGAMESGAPYMVMEYLVGSDLAHRLQEHGAIAIEEAIDYLLQACEAIAEAHAAGIVHRDLKPANLFLTRRADGSSLVKVLDFGISKATLPAGSQPDMSLTKTASVMGSPLYMAPEQMRSTRSVDARADIWALGVILYELLSGKVPFEATTMPELCAMVLTEAPAPLRDKRPDTPPGLWAVIERCLQKDPAQRFGNVSDLANALSSFAPARSRLSVERISRVLRAAGVATASLAPPPETGAAARVGDSTSAAWSPSSTSSSRRSGKLPLLLGLGAVLVAGALAAVALRGGHGEGAAASAPVPSVAPPAAAAPAAVQLAAAPSAVEAPVAAAASPAPSSAPVAPSAAAAAPRPAAARPKAVPAKHVEPAPAPAPVAPPAAPAPAPVVKKSPLNVGLK